MGRAELKGKVSLNSVGFVRGIKRIKARVAQLSRTIGAPFSQAVGTMMRIGIIAATIAVTGIVAATTAAAKYGDELGKMAKRTGVSAQELARYTLAAELSGAPRRTIHIRPRRSFREKMFGPLAESLVESVALEMERRIWAGYLRY